MKQVLQFKIILIDSEPTIWRRIQITDSCTFWDLHVAIQDSMGWKDCHLHQFMIYLGTKRKPKQQVFVGIPDEEFGLEDILAGWEIRVTDYLGSEYKIEYEYDFGDSWKHEIKFEGKFDKITGQKYPKCLDGEYACPPEDVGGIGGYHYYLEVIKDKNHPEYENYVDWNGKDFDPEKFDASKVRFYNPKVRLENMLDEITC